MRTQGAARELARNLRDAGCEAQEIEHFLELAQAGDTAGQLRILSGIRASLLERVHTGEKQITCLDYLVFQIQNTQKYTGRETL
ncbi:MAG: hypothetical protein Q4D04_11295 [Clostridia bacterium]|nr:hypothetical protein [Clostridia bacterium]